MVVEELAFRATLDATGFSGALGTMEGQLRSFGSALQNQGGVVGSLAGKLGSLSAIQLTGLVAGVTAVGAALSASISSAMSFETAMAGVAKTTGLDKTSAEFKGLQSDILSLSTTIPMAREELAGIAATAGQLGIQGSENIKTFTETIAQSATAFGMPAEAAATALAKMSNVYLGGEVEQVANLGSAINEMGNTTAATESQVMSAMARMGPLGAQYGMTADQAAGLSATLISLGMDAESAGTLTASMISGMSDPAKWSTLGEMVGMTADQFGESLTTDVTGTIMMVVQALDEIPSAAERAKAIDNIGLGIEAGKPLNALIGNLDTLDKNLTASESAFQAGTALEEEFSAATSTTAASIQILKQNIGAIGVTVGAAFLPAIATAAQGLTTLVSGAASAGQAIAGAFKDTKFAASLSGAIAQVQSTFSALSGTVGAALAPIKSALGDTFGDVSWASVLTAAFDMVLAPITSVIEAYTTLSGVAESFYTSMEGPARQWGEGIASSIETVKSAFDNAKTFITAFFDEIKSTATGSDLFSSISSGFETVGTIIDSLGTAWDGFTSALPTAASGATDAIQSLFTQFFDWISEKFGFALDPINSLIDRVEDINPFSGEGSGDGGFLDRVWGRYNEATLATAASEAGEATGEAYEDAVTTTTEGLGEDVASNLAGEDALKEAEESGDTVGGAYAKALKDRASKEVISISELFGTSSDTETFGVMQQYGLLATEGSAEHRLVEMGEIQVGDVNPGTLTFKLTDNYWTLIYTDPQGNEIARQNMGLTKMGSYGWSKEDVVGILLDEMISSGEMESHPEDLGILKTLDAEAILEVSGTVGVKSNFAPIDWDSILGPIRDLETSIQDAIDSAEYGTDISLTSLISAGLTDLPTVMKDIGSEASSALSDGFIDWTESQPIVDQLRRAKWADPEGFAEMGGEAGLEFWKGLNDQLRNLQWIQEDIAWAEAIGAFELAAKLKVEEEALKESIDESIGRYEPFIIEGEVHVTDLLGAEVPGEQDLQKLLADPTALNGVVGDWELWTENTFQPAIKQSVDDRHDILLRGYEEDITTTQDYLSRLANLYDEMPQLFDKRQSYLLSSLESAASQIGGYEKLSADAMDYWFDQWDKAEKKTAESTKESIKNLASLTAEADSCCEAMSNFGQAQEAASDMFLGSFIGSTEDRIKWLATTGEFEKRMSLGGVGLLPGEIEAVEAYRSAISGAADETDRAATSAERWMEVMSGASNFTAPTISGEDVFNPALVEESVTTTIATIESDPATLSVEGDTGPASSEVTTLTTSIESARPELSIGADPTYAYLELQGLLYDISSSYAEITVGMNYVDSGETAAPGYAGGAIVGGPTFALVGEDDPEVILNKAQLAGVLDYAGGRGGGGGGTGGGDTYQINFDVHIDGGEGTSGEDLAAKFWDAVEPRLPEIAEKLERIRTRKGSYV